MYVQCIHTLSTCIGGVALRFVLEFDLCIDVCNALQYYGYMLLSVKHVTVTMAVSTKMTVQADAGYGANRWDTAAFSNKTDKEKFSRLMVSLHPGKCDNTVGQAVLIPRVSSHTAPHKDCCPQRRQRRTCYASASQQV